MGDSFAEFDPNLTSFSFFFGDLGPFNSSFSVFNLLSSFRENKDEHKAAIIDYWAHFFVMLEHFSLHTKLNELKSSPQEPTSDQVWHKVILAAQV